MSPLRTAVLGLATLALLGLACAVPTLAGPVTELEANGTAANNTRATAQGITFASFTPNANPNVYGNLPTASISGLGSVDFTGGSDVDFYSFRTGVGIGYFDIDNDSGSFEDTILSLFDSNGTLIAYDDDSFDVNGDPDPGSTTALNSLLGTYTFTQAGTYYIVVSGYPNFPNVLFSPDTEADLIGPAGSSVYSGASVTGAAFGDSSFASSTPQTNGQAYTLNISLSNPAAVPEPSQTAALSLGLLGLAGLMLKARRRKASAV